MSRCRRRGLEGEPLLQAGAAEGVQAVEECERLVEEVGTDLSMAWLAGASPFLSASYHDYKESIRLVRFPKRCCAALYSDSPPHMPLRSVSQTAPRSATPRNLDLDLPSTSIPFPDPPVHHQRARPPPLRCIYRLSVEGVPVELATAASYVADPTCAVSDSTHHACTWQAGLGGGRITNCQRIHIYH